jgi:ribonuclease J
MPRITCYDGVNCIGGNKILLEDGGSKLFFDFGKNFGEEGKYYEEFLQPKSCCGFYEQLQLGLLPPFEDLYRQDMITPLRDPWDGLATLRVGDVAGVLVSHAHVDHIGSMHFLNPDIPIYSSPMTAAISRALQDTAAGAIPSEYCYWVGRTEREDGTLTTPHHRTQPYVSRKYYLSEETGSDFVAFWNTTPGSRELEPLPYELANTCGGLKVRGFPVDHSVYGASAWAVETSAGWVIYTGDIRMHGEYGFLTEQFAEDVAKLQPIAVIIEGTRLTSEKSYTESSVRDTAMGVVEKCQGLVVADFGPRNVERLLSFLEIARATGRELAILPKDAYLLEAMRMAQSEQTVPTLNEPGFRIYWEYQTKEDAWRKTLREKYPNLGVTPLDVAANQDKFICCFSFWDANELAYIKPALGSVWIYSSCEAFDEEMAITGERLDNWLRRYGVRREGRLLKNEQEGDPLHVSGHASKSDLLQIVRTISPRILIPVHTEHPEVYAESLSDVCEVRVPEKGVPIELGN